MEMNNNTGTSADPAPRPPQEMPPPGACDCHSHIFAPVDLYPYARQRKYSPPQASLKAYRHMLATLGVDRAVIVQPSVYGFDNRATLDALKTGGDNFRGVAVIDPNLITRAELDRMHHIGIRGVRVNQAYDHSLDMKYLHKVVERIQPLGWHLQIFADVNNIPDFKAEIAGLPVEVVIDHMGFVATAKGVNNTGFLDLLSLLKQGKCWVKLSGAYRMSAQSRPPYADVTAFAQALVKANPYRCVWGTDWPHPHIDTPVPNDGDLLDLLSLWVPDRKVRNAILVDNPAILYDFPAI